MMQTENLSKRFGAFQALDDVNLRVDTGSVYGLVGPNGAGKSTLLRCMAGVYRPESGRVTLDGAPVFENRAVKSRVLLVAEGYYAFGSKNTMQMQRLFRSLYPTFDAALFDRLGETFPPVDEKKPLARLSKGMNKQVALRLALACRPKALLLDEPLDGLDPLARRQVASALMENIAENETQVVISSHNLRELEDLCDTLGILNNGRLILQSELSALSEDLCKIQAGFPDAPPQIADTHILHQKIRGNSAEYVVRGSKTQLTPMLKTAGALFIQELPLSLEEIFIYELGGADDELRKVLS